MLLHLYCLSYLYIPSVKRCCILSPWSFTSTPVRPGDIVSVSRGCCDKSLHTWRLKQKVISHRCGGPLSAISRVMPWELWEGTHHPRVSCLPAPSSQLLLAATLLGYSCVVRSQPPSSL